MGDCLLSTLSKMWYISLAIDFLKIRNTQIYWSNLIKLCNKTHQSGFNDTVNSFENRNSIVKIKEYYKDELSFEFKQFTTNELLKII